MPEFQFQEMFPSHEDTTSYRKLTSDFVGTATFNGRDVLTVEPEALTTLTAAAFHDISHLLRPGHLQQLRNILDDGEASPNDRYVALELLKNANISAGGILPMCQDTGTAIVMGKKGQAVWTGGGDEAAIARGVYKTYTETNLRYSQVSPLSMFKEVQTGTNLPAQIDIYATDGDAYKFLFVAKGGGSANKTYLHQQTPAVLNEASLLKFLDTQIRTLGTAACPPYHLAIVVGGTSAEMNLKTVKLASTRYLDDLPGEGNDKGIAIRDREMEHQRERRRSGIPATRERLGDKAPGFERVGQGSLPESSRARSRGNRPGRSAGSGRPHAGVVCVPCRRDVFGPSSTIQKTRLIPPATPMPGSGAMSFSTETESRAVSFSRFVARRKRLVPSGSPSDCGKS